MSESRLMSFMDNDLVLASYGNFTRTIYKRFFKSEKK